MGHICLPVIIVTWTHVCNNNNNCDNSCSASNNNNNLTDWNARAQFNERVRVANGKRAATEWQIELLETARNWKRLATRETGKLIYRTHNWHALLCRMVVLRAGRKSNCVANFCTKLTRQVFKRLCARALSALLHEISSSRRLPVIKCISQLCANRFACGRRNRASDKTDH